MTTRRPNPLSQSLRLRFLLAVMLWVVLGIAAIWFSATRVFTSHVEAGFHDELNVHVRELARLTRLDEQGRPMLIRPLSDPRYDEPLSGYYWQVTVEGQAPLRSQSLTHGSLDDSIAHSRSITHKVESGPTGRLIAYGLAEVGPHGETVHLVIATDESEMDRVVEGFTRELTIWLIALGALLLATGIAIIGFGLKPLNRLGDSIARLRAGQAELLEGRYPTEIAPLVEDLNDYIRQNGEMITRARVQAGNLAHSLRTPLAVITDEAERMAERPDGSTAAAVLLEQAQTMEQQIEYQLARARSSAGSRVPGSSSVLPDLLVPVISAMKRLHPEIQFAIRNRLGGDRRLPIDPIDLGELLSILIDNAGKWAGSQVTVTLDEIEGRLVAEVADDGPGMPPDQIARAFEIGSRFDAAKPGSGLGLAIARDICANLGARITLQSQGKGLVATVTFP